MTQPLSVPSERVKPRIVGSYDSFDVSRVQRLNINGDIPTTDVNELGNSRMAGTTQDTPNVTLSFSLFDVGIKAFSVLTGTNPAAYPASGVDITNLGEVDAILYVKDDSVSDYAKTCHARRLQVRDFAFSYSVDGESTEDYTLIGSEKRWFKNDVIVDRFASGTTSFTLSQTPIVLKNGHYALSVILDGDYLTEVTGAPATGEYRIVGTTLTTGDSRTSQVLAVYHANPAGNNWADTSDATLPVAIKGRDVPIKISANTISRVQSVTINGNMNVQAVKEMGNRAIVGYQSQVPTIEGTISVLDTDTQLIDLLVTGSTNSGDTEFELGTTCTASGLSLKIELLDPCDSTVPYTVLKTIYIPSLSIVGDAFSTNVNQNATQSFNFKSASAQCIVYSGSI